MIEPGLEASLLEVLRRRTGAPDLRYAAPPVRVTGGFWAEILAIRLEGAPPELDRDLIVRIMPDSAIAARETIVQSEVVSQGFPAPPVRMTGEATDGLGRPFMVMDRAPGRTPLAEMPGPGALAGVGRAAIRIPELLARTAAHLHALDAAPLRRSLGDLFGRLEERARDANRPDLAGAARALPGSRPASDREAICHGDLHPFNLLVDRGRVTVVDWSVGLVADPAFDLAFTAMTMALAPVNVPRPFRRPFRAAARGASRQFLRRYRHHAPTAGASLSDETLDWYMAFHCLRALAEVGEWVETGTANDRAGHPWLMMAPQMAVRLGAMAGRPVRPM